MQSCVQDTFLWGLECVAFKSLFCWRMVNTLLFYSTLFTGSSHFLLKIYKNESNCLTLMVVCISNRQLQRFAGVSAANTNCNTGMTFRFPSRRSSAEIALNGGPWDMADWCAEHRCTFLDAAASDGPRQIWILLLLELDGPNTWRLQLVSAGPYKFPGQLINYQYPFRSFF
jgi:hypothetical protein